MSEQEEMGRGEKSVFPASCQSQGLAFCLSEASTQQLGFGGHRGWAGHVLPRLVQWLLVQVLPACHLLAEGREEVWVPGVSFVPGRCLAPLLTCKEVFQMLLGSQAEADVPLE